jgi:hypothetical protein
VKLVEGVEFGGLAAFTVVVRPWVPGVPAVLEWLFIEVSTVKFELKKEPAPFPVGGLLSVKEVPPAPVKQLVEDRLPVPVQ